jgi:pantoate--beta-alanine ligase
MIPILARTRLGLAAARHALPAPVVLVPTMGALHDGHRALLRRAREISRPNGSVVVSVFVNPLQFGPGEDLDRYPRSLDDDMKICGAEGASVVFAPGAAQMYRQEQLITIDPGPMGQVLEGASRPGFFTGVLTVVLKLLQLTRPDAAVFGEKDAQQLALVRRMVSDLNFPVEIVGVPTVRATDGLALSSRNRFLSDAERDAALVLSRALRLLEQRANAHEPLDLDSALAMVESQPLVSLDYFDVVDPGTLEPLAENCRETPFRGEALALIAAKVGPVRLIDNVPLSS